MIFRVSVSIRAHPWGTIFPLIALIYTDILRFCARPCPSVVGIIYLASVPICEICGRLVSCKHMLVDPLQSLRDLFVAQLHRYDSLAAVEKLFNNDYTLELINTIAILKHQYYS